LKNQPEITILKILLLPIIPFYAFGNNSVKKRLPEEYKQLPEIFLSGQAC